MVTVLRRLNGSGLLEKYPNLSAYVARGEARLRADAVTGLPLTMTLGSDIDPLNRRLSTPDRTTGPPPHHRAAA